LSYRKAD